MVFPGTFTHISKTGYFYKKNPMLIRKNLCLIMGSLLLILNSHNSYAGFLLKKHNKPLVETVVGSDATADLEIGRQAFATPKENLKSNLCHTDNPSNKNSGWEGTASMWCAIGGIVFFPALICSIVFGAMGLKKGKKHRNRAIAGLAISLNIIFLFILLLAFA